MTEGPHARHGPGGEFFHDRRAALFAAERLHDEALSLADASLPGTLGGFDQETKRFARLSAAGWDREFPWHSRAHWQNMQQRAQLGFAAVYRGMAAVAVYAAKALRAASDNSKLAEDENEFLFETFAVTGRPPRLRGVRWVHPGPPPGGTRAGVFDIVPTAPGPEPPIRVEIMESLLKPLAEGKALEIHHDMGVCWRAAAHRLEQSYGFIRHLSGEVAEALWGSAGERIGLLAAAANNLSRFALATAGATNQAAGALVGLRGSLGAEPGPAQVRAQFQQISRHFVELSEQMPPELKFALPFAGVGAPVVTDRDTTHDYPDTYFQDPEDPLPYLGVGTPLLSDEVVGNSYWDPGPEPEGPAVIA